MSKNSQKSHAVNMILNYRNFFERVSNLVESARRKTIRQINSVIIETYWRVGKLLVEEDGTEATYSQNRRVEAVVLKNK